MNEETEINPTEDGKVEKAAPETPPSVEPEILSSPLPPGVEPEILSSPPPPGVEPEFFSSPPPPVATPEAAEVEMQTAVSVEQIQSEATQPLPPKAEKSKHRRKRISLFFPLLLIFIGVVFLLRNFGYINADTWDLLINLWPAIFIALGLDAIWRGEGITGAIFNLGIGVVFLLGNFGLLEMSPWMVLITLWPVLLIAIGFDMLTGWRKSTWITLLGVVVVLGVLVGALWFAGVRLPGSQVQQGETIEVPIGDATQARISIEPGAGRLILDRTDIAEMLLTGTVPPAREGSSVIVDTSQEGSLAKVDISSAGLQFFYSQDQMAWDLGVTGELPVEMEVDLAAGESYLNLGGLNLENLDYSMAVGAVQIVLSDADNFNGKLSGAIGTLRIVVPQNVGVEIQMNTALVYRNIPEDYTRHDHLYTSPNYDQAEYRIRLEVNLAIGQVMVEQQ